MYKIMLADDEGIVIDSLKFIIDKEFGEECEVQFAKTGRSVIELAESFRPDIAIMDIQMPGINGIEAIRQIQSRNPQVVFIIMTAYDRFNYAKEAVTLGVFEYLNKPIDRTVIVNTLRQAMEKIQKERAARSKELEIREKLETIVPVIENGLIYDILFRENFSEDVDNFKNILGITANYGYMAVLVCGDDQQGTHLTNAVGSSIRLYRIYSEIREQLKNSFDCCVGSAMGNKLALFIPCNAPGMEYAERIELIEKGRRVIRELKKEYDASFRLGFGSVSRLEELNSSYAEALEALHVSDGSVAHADDVPIRVGYEENYPVELEKALFAAVDRRDKEDALTNAGDFFDWMAGNYSDAIDDVKLKALEFVLWTEHLVYEQGGSVYYFRSRSGYLPAIMAMDNLSELRTWFMGKIREACDNAESRKGEQSDSVIGRAARYIEEHYSDKDISLDEVSREVDVSPYYFSRLFKEETGENFIDYVTRIRIDKAKELLSGTDMSMKEICASIGYSDPNYFSRSFKKNVGVTPTEFKEQQG